MSERATPAGRRARHTLLLFLLVGTLWTACLATHWIWQVSGIGDTSIPFLDLYALLAAGETAHAGGDPFQPSPLDPFHRPHLYSTWWLVSGSAGLTRADTRWVGWSLAGATLIAAVAYLRPRNRRELIHAVLVLGSPPVLMNLQRGNNDLVVFVVVTGGLLAWRSRAVAARLGGAGLLALAAVLKYYPLAALVAVLQARTRRELLGAGALAAIVLAVGVPGLLPGLASAARYAPQPVGLYTFGAPALFRYFGLPAAVGWALPVAVIAAWTLMRLLRRPPVEPASGTALDEEGGFAAGAALIVACFLLGASYSYKLIFAVFLLPWLGATAGSAAGGRTRQALWGLLVAVLWLEGLLAVFINLVLTPLSTPFALRVVDITVVVSQLAGWALVALLLSWLATYVLRRFRAQGLALVGRPL